MTDAKESRDPGKDFFRPAAVERYEAFIELDTPELLVRWRPGLLVAALIPVGLTAWAAFSLG